MNLRAVAFWMLAACAALASAADVAPRFVQRLALPSQQTVVVAEGEFEARSTGSYSIRVYSTEAPQPDDGLTFYAAGILRPRSGTVESISLAFIDIKGPPMLVVTMKSTGSSGYLSAEAFVVTRDKIRLAVSVSGLAPTADPEAALRLTFQSRHGKRRGA